ncbi:hypothetical protein BABINDRAFT_171643 [Babjeviella inositovora NRRL Y-12698]|uniref:Cytochrome b5 heme-binding domain-containing protein n=1 Tax=Babjeviella inositovora NRRL Y-12698 TaxID=984486 RepID=A0A1E3QPM6_9ASCO|nr:uncharacterized protein BABINDRAFT_171643 [Babjeviella inositovora NRRL Y-12698]ODQ79414.1 hypothetical protein BABINDRAFT_171643 [Babjeviella inositovora NRRL Y-12698]
MTDYNPPTGIPTGAGTLTLTKLPSRPIIVVGGGLAGLSAAHQAYLNGSNVVLIDKQSFFGGNSTKATSGINGALTRTQIDLKLADSVQQFYEDTMKTAKDRANPELIKVLTYNSADAVHWLQEVFGLDLTLVSRLGGHSQPRTHRGKDSKFPGMAITYALMEKLEQLAEDEPERVALIKKAEATNLLKQGAKTTGVKYVQDKKTQLLSGPVIMATGGYAADFTKTSLLKQYRPDIIDLPSTNGTHATGDGQKIILQNGGVGIDMDKVQVHPTGLLQIDSPPTKIGGASAKLPRYLFLGAEALRGEGGFMIDSTGRRFCDELGTRDYVSGEMTKVKGPIRLILNSKAANNLAFHVKHYTHRGLMKPQKAADIAKEMGIELSVLKEEMSKYNRYAEGKAKDPFGKQFFPSTPLAVDDDFHVSFVTRVLHFTMGGVKINLKSEVLDAKNKVIEGLYAAGELAGGIHGHNRLGGSSLLGCVVYGRVAADAATNHLLQTLSVAPVSTAQQRLKQISIHLDPNVPDRVTIDWGNGEVTSPVETPAKTVKAPAKASAKKAPVKKPVVKAFKIPAKEYTLAEVAKHNTAGDCWVIVKDCVLDCTGFLADHPGGEQSIINFAGMDATEVFAMLHEDRVIPKYAASSVIGRVKGKTPKLEL